MSTETSLRREIATEQRHLDRVYARLAQLRREAKDAERDGYHLARVGNLGALVERDAMVLHAARRRHALDAEHEGLVFGRLDRRDGRVEYVGRLGIRDADATPLVIDWRAPAAADFYQATAADPRGVVRRRMIRSSGEAVTGLDDDLLDPAAAPPGLPVVGDGALLASLTRATGQEMRDIVATIQREQDEAIRSPASGVTLVEGGPGTGKPVLGMRPTRNFRAPAWRYVTNVRQEAQCSAQLTDPGWSSIRAGVIVPGWYLHAVASVGQARERYAVARQRQAFQVSAHIFDVAVSQDDWSLADRLSFGFAAAIGYRRSGLDPNATAMATGEEQARHCPQCESHDPRRSGHTGNSAAKSTISGALPLPTAPRLGPTPTAGNRLDRHGRGCRRWRQRDRNTTRVLRRWDRQRAVPPRALRPRSRLSP